MSQSRNIGVSLLYRNWGNTLLASLCATKVTKNNLCCKLMFSRLLSFLFKDLERTGDRL